MEETHKVRYGERVKKFHASAGVPLSLNLHVFDNPEAALFIFNYSLSIYLKYTVCIMHIILKI